MERDSVTSNTPARKEGGLHYIKITIKRNGKGLFEHKFVRVEADAGPQYTGSQVGFVEQAMQATMADSLAELLRVPLPSSNGAQLDQHVVREEDFRQSINLRG